MCYIVTNSSSGTHNTGWLLDVSVEQNRAIIWVKTLEGKILKLVDIYQPTFYVLPRDGYTGSALFQDLSQQSTVKKLEWHDKFTDLFTYDLRGMKRLICVYPESILHHKTLIKRLEQDPRVAKVFNTDLSHIQQYLFTKLKIELTSKVEVEYDKNDSKVIKISKIKDDDDVATPPFSILYFEIHTISSYNLGHDVTDPVTEIRVRYQEEPEISLEGSENVILESFCEYIQAKDPDILFSSNQHSRSTSTLDYLFARMGELGLDLQLGRDKQTSETNKIGGRVRLKVI